MSLALVTIRNHFRKLIASGKFDRVLEKVKKDIFNPN